MYCTQCGFELEDQDLYCAKCGKATRPGCPPAGLAHAVLSRPMDQKKLGGVCAGFARYFDADVTLMRILWIAMAIITGGLGFLVYLVAWILMPKDYPAPGGEPTRAAQPV
jgi:phage shock protein C